jgi:hypothetical protein
MKTSKFDKKIHNNDVKLKKGLKHHGWSWGMDGD